MKIKLQTLLKHKLQWLVLLAALLGVSQGVWGYTVYFDNTNTNWNNVYIYFYNSNYWNGNGSGSQNIASGPNVMTHVSGNIWSYENNGNYTRVAFTKDSQSNYGNFHTTEAAYSDGTDFNVTGSLSSSTPLFTPSTTKTTKNGNVPYYSGAWSAYSPCTAPSAGTAKVDNVALVDNVSTKLIDNGGTATVAVSGYTSGCSVQWYCSTDNGGNWSATGQPTTDSFTAGPLTQPTWYKAKITNPSDECFAYSNLVKVNTKTAVRVYVGDVSWDNVKIHGWNGSGNQFGSFPGAAMTNVCGSWWEYQFDNTLTGLIFSGNGCTDNCGNNQTVDITDLPTSGQITYYKVNTTTGNNDRRTCDKTTPSSFTSVSVSPAELDVDVNNKATLTPSSDPSSSVTWTFKSSDVSKATVAYESSVWKVTGVAAGSATITASASNSTHFCESATSAVTVLSCTAPTSEFNASATDSNLYFSNGDNVSTTLSTAANSNWDFQWVCTQKPTYGAITYNPTITSATNNSTTVTFPIEGVYKFKVKAKCKSDDEDAWVESTEVTVTVHLKLHLKGPITCSACAFTGDCETYTQICDLTNTNTVTYNFMGYYKNSADYKGEFCIDASSDAGDGNHIHTEDTYTDNNLNLTAGITYNTSHNYNLMSDGLTIAETGTPLTLTITHTGGKNYTLSLALLNCPDISIKTHPSSTAQTLCKNGSPTNLTVEGQGGTTPYTFQWYQNSECATSGATMVSGATSATITPATTANGTLYYYCVVSSAGFCSGKKATSNVSGGVTVATPKLTASATSVTNFTPVVITSDVVLNNTKFTITDVQSTDSYLYENTTESVIFKGDVGDGSSKTFTISGTARDVSCTGTVDITVSKDANSCD